jgi:CRP-like cAMP-binding protein/Fe-S-cluster-containing hydrogenase component 2
MGATMVMLTRQHGDRWSSFGEHAGIKAISSLLTPDQLKRIDILEEFDDAFLRELSPDIIVAKWNAGAVIFEAGTYLDLAFYIADGEVEMQLPDKEGSARPIFTSRGSAGLSVAQVAEMAAKPSAKKVVPAKNITFLAAADFDLAQGERMRLREGELFGEIGAMNGWPQSVSARTATTCTLVQIRVPAIRKLRRKSKKLKQRLDDLYRQRTLRQHLAATPILDGIDGATMEQLVARVELVSASPGDVVTKQGEPVEHLILVRSGSLKMSQPLGVSEVVVGYVSKGATVGESELLLDDLGTWNVTTTSVGHSELVRIPKADLLQVVERNPELQQRLWGIATARIKELGFRRNNLERADLLDFTLAKGLTQANSVLVIDLEKCTRCDDCVRGCASTHGGTARFVREGEVYDGFMVARSCYHCQDPTCLVGCPTGAITRLNIGDVVAIDPTVCIGCGACAENCQYDSIVVHELGTKWGADAMPKHLRGQPRSVAMKCDLCYSAPQGPACVASCPHGAAFRVAGAEEFDALLETKRRGVRAVIG